MLHAAARRSPIWSSCRARSRPARCWHPRCSVRPTDPAGRGPRRRRPPLFGIVVGRRRARACGGWSPTVSSRRTTAATRWPAASSSVAARRRRGPPAYVSERPWDGTWELAVVALDRRPAARSPRAARAASRLHLAELREGVWVRPDNLDPERLPTSRAVLERPVRAVPPCRHRLERRRRRHAVRSRCLGVGRPAADRRDRRRGRRRPAATEVTDVLTFRFLLSVAVIRLLQLDSHLPVQLLPADWPAEQLPRRLPPSRCWKHDLTAAGRSSRTRRRA